MRKSALGVGTLCLAVVSIFTVAALAQTEKSRQSYIQRLNKALPQGVSATADGTTIVYHYMGEGTEEFCNTAFGIQAALDTFRKFGFTQFVCTNDRDKRFAVDLRSSAGLASNPDAAPNIPAQWAPLASETPGITEWTIPGTQAEELPPSRQAAPFGGKWRVGEIRDKMTGRVTLEVFLGADAPVSDGLRTATPVVAMSCGRTKKGRGALNFNSAIFNAGILTSLSDGFDKRGLLGIDPLSPRTGPFRKQGLLAPLGLPGHEFHVDTDVRYEGNSQDRRFQSSIHRRRWPRIRFGVLSGRN